MAGLYIATEVYEPLWLCYTYQFGYYGSTFSTCIDLEFGIGFLREKTNGLHMPTKLSCFVFSLFFEYLSLFIICRLLSNVSVMTNANSQYDKQKYFVMISGKIKDTA